MRDEQEDFRRKYGDSNQIRASLDLANQTQQKINRLLSDLDNTMASFENQLSCYKCSGMI